MQTTTYDRAVWSDVGDTQSTTRNYTITWTSNATTWYVDGTAVRTLAYANALDGKNYPQTPMNIRIGIWAGGDSSNDEGTIEWAGGETNYDDGPYTMALEKIEVVNDTPGTSYVYGDTSGGYDSIEVEDGESASTTSKGSDTTTTGTVVSKKTGTATSTLTGMWWTASARAAVNEATKSEAVGNRLFGLWRMSVCAVLSIYLDMV